MTYAKTVPAIATLACVFSLAACKRDTADVTKMNGTDTVLTARRVQDTTVVKADTTVRTDTVKQTHHLPVTTRP